MPHAVLRVSSTVRIPNPARRLGQIAPLETRWREAVERIRYELPPGHPMQAAGNGMRSEIALDDLLDGLEAAKAALAARPPDPMVTAAARELYEYKRQWNSAVIEIKNNQSWLTQKVGDWKYRLMGSLVADMFVVPQTVSTSIDDRPTFASFTAARKAVTDFLPKLQQLSGICELIKEARRFEAQAPEQQNLDLIRALVVRKQEADARIIALESANTALQARMDRLERSRRKKGKAAIREAA